MKIFGFEIIKNLQLLGASHPDPHQGRCPWTPLGAFSSPQTPRLQSAPPPPAAAIQAMALGNGASASSQEESGEQLAPNVN